MLKKIRIEDAGDSGVLPGTSMDVLDFYDMNEKLEAEGFDTKERLSLLHRDSTNFQKGLTVTTFYMAKGLEFDQVFSVFPGEDRSPIVERARYIAATRALHELYMYEVVK